MVVAIVKTRLQLSASLYEILQILSLTEFEKIALDQLPAQSPVDDRSTESPSQLILFHLRWDTSDQLSVIGKRKAVKSSGESSRTTDHRRAMTMR